MKIKRKFLLYAFVLVLMSGLPFLALGASYNKSKTAQASASSYDSSSESKAEESTESVSEEEQHESEKAESVTDTPEISEESSADGGFKILDTSSGTVLTLTDEEFLIGAVAAEMPPNYETEALKAQCVAAYTCYSEKRAAERAKPHEELKGADFSANLSEKEIYLTPEIMKQDCGDSYDEVYSKYKSVVESVSGELITYKGEPIVCTYFAVSCGETDSYEDIFGKALPYLTAVSSPYDLLAPNYESEVTLSADEFKAALEAASDKTDFSQSTDEWIGDITRTASGTVKSITVGGESFSGAELREILGLKSACFEIEYDGEFIISVKGYGHNVGMSQYGANEMAKNGSDYKEILHHYYKGAD